MIALVALAFLALGAGNKNLPTSGTVVPTVPGPYEFNQRLQFVNTINGRVPPRSFIVDIIYCDQDGVQVFSALHYGGSILTFVLGGDQSAADPGGYYLYQNDWTGGPAECEVYEYLDYHNGTSQEAFTGVLAEYEFDVEDTAV